MAGEVSGNTLNYSDINSGKLLNKAGLLELSGQIKGYIQANTPSTVLTSQVDTGKVDQTTNDPIFLDDYLDDLEQAISNTTTYTLPVASTSTLGGVKVDGSTITIDQNGVISSSGGGGSSYTFTNGLTESNGTVSWDLDNFIKKGSRSLLFGEGNINSIGGNYSVAMCQTSTEMSMVGGRNSLVIGPGQSAMLGSYQFVQGHSCYSTGNHTICMGNSLKGNKGAFIEGKYNIAETNGIFQHIIGNGTTDESRSNASALDWSGNQYLAGNLFVNCNNYTTTSSGLQTAGCGGSKVATEAFVNSKIPTAPVADGTYMLKCVVSNGEPTYSWESVSVGGSY